MDEDSKGRSVEVRFWMLDVFSIIILFFLPSDGNYFFSRVLQFFILIIPAIMLFEPIHPWDNSVKWVKNIALTGAIINILAIFAGCFHILNSGIHRGNGIMLAINTSVLPLGNAYFLLLRAFPRD
jgi:hypothetical protein